MRFIIRLASTAGLVPALPGAKSSGPMILVSGIELADGAVGAVAALRSSKYAIPANTKMARLNNKPPTLRAFTHILMPHFVSVKTCCRSPSLGLESRLVGLVIHLDRINIDINPGNWFVAHRVICLTLDGNNRTFNLMRFKDISGRKVLFFDFQRVLDGKLTQFP